MEQSPSEVIMVRPAAFGFNAETAESNVFQTCKAEGAEIQKKALEEFDSAVENLRRHGVVVHVFDDTPLPVKPDAIFPNNWFSCHHDGLVVIYPMLAPSRQAERRQDVIDFLKENKKVTKIIDLSHFEKDGIILEGTGSIIFDYPNKKAYGCRSSRCDEFLMKALCSFLNFEPIIFTSLDTDNNPIYHTNVMMWIGKDVAAVCLDSIADDQERKNVHEQLSTNRTLVELSFHEMSNFAGNCIELVGNGPKPLLAMSRRAHTNMSKEKLSVLEKFVDIVECNVDTIEQVGGGGIRCMIAGIHLPEK